jgi:hypothetical protein
MQVVMRSSPDMVEIKPNRRRVDEVFCSRPLWATDEEDF